MIWLWVFVIPNVCFFKRESDSSNSKSFFITNEFFGLAICDLSQCLLTLNRLRDFCQLFFFSHLVIGLSGVETRNILVKFNEL